jgi:hypothetical protein
MASTLPNKIATPLSDAHLRAIGLVAWRWSVAEHLLEIMIWKLLGVERETGLGVTTHMRFESRLNAIKSILAGEEISARITSAIDALDALRNDRNSVIHNLWHGDEPSSAVSGHKVSARGKVSEKVTVWSAEDIVELADAIEEAVSDVVDLLAELPKPPSKSAG